MSSILSSSRIVRDERGSALVVAFVTMLLMLSMGFAAMSLADFSTGQSRVEREGESSFNLSEGAMSAQLFVLSQRWPGTADGAFPAQCNPTTSANERCPDNA